MAINAPSGEGKTYTINKVFDLFPKNDVIILAGMTDKALFHRHGKLVIWNEKEEKHEFVKSLEETIGSRY